MTTITVTAKGIEGQLEYNVALLHAQNGVQHWINGLDHMQTEELVKELQVDEPDYSSGKLAKIRAIMNQHIHTSFAGTSLPTPVEPVLGLSIMERKEYFVPHPPPSAASKTLHEDERFSVRLEFGDIVVSRNCSFGHNAGIRVSADQRGLSVDMEPRSFPYDSQGENIINLPIRVH